MKFLRPDNDTRSSRGSRFRTIYRKYGWKMFIGIVLLYLIRDTVLYLLLPYLLARGVLG